MTKEFIVEYVNSLPPEERAEWIRYLDRDYEERAEHERQLNKRWRERNPCRMKIKYYRELVRKNPHHAFDLFEGRSFRRAGSQGNWSRSEFSRSICNGCDRPIDNRPAEDCPMSRHAIYYARRLEASRKYTREHIDARKEYDRKYYLRTRETPDQTVEVPPLSRHP